MTADRTIEQSLSCEQEFQLDSFDGKKISCWLNKADNNPSKKAIILSHGLTGSPYEYIHMMARNYFNERGYDVYRFAYYWSEPDNRILHDCTLDIHSKDLNTVIAHVQEQHDKVFVCGHSYGGATMLFANPEVAAVSFWDSSFVSTFWKEDAVYEPSLDYYKLGWGIDHIIGKAMYEEGVGITQEQAALRAQKLATPAQVIHAGICDDEVWRTGLYEALNEPKELYTVKNAGHCFTEGNTIFDLLDKTHQWFERF